MRKFLEFVVLLSKTILLSSATALIILAAFSFISLPKRPHGHKPLPTTMSVEQKASHYLYLQGSYGGLGVCTGTAIGPHAILTAAHCDKENEVKQVQIDLATETHEVMSTATDGRDHIIMLVDGTPFTNIETVVYGTAALGEPVVFYGVGGAVYPPVAKHGVVSDCQDPSDVDAAAGQWCMTASAIPGDSGSTVYNTKGQVIGIVTYLDRDTEPAGTIGYALAFTDEQLVQAAEFDGEHTPRPKEARAEGSKRPCDVLSAMFSGCR